MKYNALIPEFIVNDMELSRAFYIDLLGFTVEYERPEDTFVFLSCGEAQLMLEEATPEEKMEEKCPFGKERINFSQCGQCGGNLCSLSENQLSD